MIIRAAIYKLNLIFFFENYQVRLGHSAANPGKSCKDILESKDSEGDGEYWIDPEGKGNPLKVYCDMNTDRGK